MIYRILADIVVWIHFSFIAFVILGGFLVRWRLTWGCLHLPAVVWAVGIEWTGGICPLTEWENVLAVKGALSGYHGSFISHYLTSIIYPEGLTRNHQLLFGGGVLILNGLIYIHMMNKALRNKD